MEVIGTHDQQRRVWQDVAVSGSAGDSFVLAGWAKGCSVPLDPEAESYPSDFAIRATFTYTDGTTSETTKNIARFNPWVDSTVNWQYAATAVVADKDYSSIKVELIYDYNANTVLFDAVQLYKEEFGSSYTYDDEGNVIAVKDLQAQTTEYEYENNNLTAQILPTGAKLTYDYDDYHNVKTATSSTGVVYNFAYDDYGNNTSVSIVSGDTSITSTAVYTTDGNRLSSTTDAAGKTTQYSIDENTNVLNWIQYPEDTETSRTQYTYDTMYRLATAQAAVDGATSPLTASYTYEDDLLTKIETGSTTYSFSYGDFALRSSIQIGSQTLAEYTYTTDRNNYLSRLDYGNEDSVNYTYDDYGRVVSQTYEDGDTVSYTYDNSGALAKVTDSATGITTTYYYDFTDRLLRYEEESSTLSHTVGYGYDTINNLTSLVETINGVTHTTSYEYDTDNRVTAVTGDTTTKTYSYDESSRVITTTTTSGITEIVKDTLSYYAPSRGLSTGLVSSYTIDAANFDASFSYSYDDNGNITAINYGTTPAISYAYDTANQLVRENDRFEGKTWTWTYDNAGNILSRSEYAYTTGELGDPVDTVTYSYDDEWGDLLTGYDGNTITSDEIGNMLSDGTWTYTWEHGRQLASMSDGTTTWNYTYNSDGLRTTRSNGNKTYTYVYNGSQLTQLTIANHTLYFAYDASGTPMTVTYNDMVYYYVTNLQGDVIAILNSIGKAVVEYNYDAWGNILYSGGSMIGNLGTINPLRYRGYVYDAETELYYLQSRYYNPELGRFLNEDAYIATGQGLIGNNMFAYCNNNSICFSDPSGYLPLSQFAYACYNDVGCFPYNTEFLMAFYGVDSPNEIPEMPEGAMIFVENITSVSVQGGVGIVEGRTIVMDAYKYCEYTFVGVGASVSKSIPFDRCITQGYVYGIENVEDYCGWFVGGTANMLSTAYGGAFASLDVYAKVVGGMSYAPSIGVSATWYITGQTDWIYGPANMVVKTNPYQYASYNSPYQI